MKRKIDWTWLLLFLLLPVAFAPYYFSKVWWPSREFNECTGVIGDTIGGIAGPLVSAISAILVYIAFRAQVKANRLVQEQFELQGLYDELEALEGYADDLESKMYSRKVKEDGRWVVAKHDADSIILRAWAYRIGVAKDMVEKARKTKNSAAIDRIEAFAMDRLKPLIVQLNDRIPDSVNAEALGAWRDAYDNYFK